jgi:hypothetical protein
MYYNSQSPNELSHSSQARDTMHESHNYVHYGSSLESPQRQTPLSASLFLCLKYGILGNFLKNQQLNG